MSHNWRSYRKKLKQTGDNKSILQFFNKASTEQAGSSQSQSSQSPLASQDTQESPAQPPAPLTEPTSQCDDVSVIEISQSQALDIREPTPSTSVAQYQAIDSSESSPNTSVKESSPKKPKLASSDTDARTRA